MTQVRPAVGSVAVALAVALGAGAAWMLREPGQVRPPDVAPEPAVMAEPPAPTMTPPPAAVTIVDRPAVPDARDAMLHLRLVGDPGGQPVAMEVRLWRLGLPETESWTAGDQVESDVTVPEDGLDMTLPAGRYRLECLDLRRGADDPAEFTVAAGASSRVIAVAHRREVHSRLRIVDEMGNALRESAKRQLGRSLGVSSSHKPPLATWASPRLPKSGERTQEHDDGRFGRGDWPADNVVTTALADGSAHFDLGRHREQGQRGYQMWSTEFQPADRVAVVVVGKDAIRTDTTYVAISPRIDTLLSQVRRPDGSPVPSSDAKVKANCTAVRHPWEPPADSWKTVSVRVELTCDGFRPLTFSWTAATASERHVLEPE